MEETLGQIFSEALGVPQSEINDETAYNSHEAWDSLKHLEIIDKIEKEFKIDIEMDDVIAMENFKKAKKIINKYINKK